MQLMQTSLVLKEKGHTAFSFPKLHDSKLNAIIQWHEDF